MKTAAKRKNFHLPLPAETYSQLRDAAQRLKMPATQVAREVIENWLRSRKKAALFKNISEYAAANAGGSADLDSELESASIKYLRVSEDAEDENE
jgi:hypothetical protein